MSEAYAAFKAIKLCPGITLLDLLQLERLAPMRHQAVLPFLKDICQRKKLLMLEGSRAKEWPEQLIEQEAIVLLLDEWACFLPVKLNTCLMFGEVTALLVTSQPTDVASQLNAFKQTIEKERTKRVKASPLRRKTKVEFETTEVKLLGKRPASIKLIAALNLLLREDSLFNLAAASETLKSCCSEFALRELKTDYWAFIMKRTNLSIDVIRKRLEEAESALPREPQPDVDTFEEPMSSSMSTRAHLVEATEDNFHKDSSTKKDFEESKTDQDLGTASTSPATKVLKKSSKKLLEDKTLNTILSETEPKPDKPFKRDLTIDSKTAKKLTDMADINTKTSTNTHMQRAEKFEAKDRSDLIDMELLSKQVSEKMVLPAKSSTDAGSVLMPEYLRSILREELSSSSSLQDVLSQNQEPAFRSMTDIEEDSRSPRPIDYSRETPVNVLSSSELSFSSSEAYGSLVRISEVKEETLDSNHRLRLPVAFSSDSSFSLDNESDDEAHAGNLPQRKSEIFNHKNDLFKPRYMLQQLEVGEPLEEPQEREEMMECCSCECSCTDTRCALF